MNLTDRNGFVLFPGDVVIGSTPTFNSLNSRALVVVSYNRKHFTALDVESLTYVSEEYKYGHSKWISTLRLLDKIEPNDVVRTSTRVAMEDIDNVRGLDSFSVLYRVVDKPSKTTQLFCKGPSKPLSTENLSSTQGEKTFPSYILDTRETGPAFLTVYPALPGESLVLRGAHCGILLGIDEEGVLVNVANGEGTSSYDGIYPRNSVMVVPLEEMVNVGGLRERILKRKG